MDKRKILLSFIVLGSLLVSLALAFNMFSKGIQHSFAQSSGVTVTDFWINGGQEPWGVTFDSKGNVWVAVPGILQSIIMAKSGLLSITRTKLVNLIPQHRR